MRLRECKSVIIRLLQVYTNTHLVFHKMDITLFFILKFILAVITFKLTNVY